LVAPGRRDANIKVQSSEDLISWNDNVQEILPPEIDPNGFELKKFRFSEPLKNGSKSAFLRINITLSLIHI